MTALRGKGALSVDGSERRLRRNDTALTTRVFTLHLPRAVGSFGNLPGPRRDRFVSTRLPSLSTLKFVREPLFTTWREKLA